MKKTENLNLNLWEGNDRVKRVDFVEDNLKIDNAYKDLLNKCEELEINIDNIDISEELEELRTEIEQLIDDIPDVFHDLPQNAVKESMPPKDFKHGVTVCSQSSIATFPTVNDYGMTITVRGVHSSYGQLFITRNGDIWSRRSGVLSEWNGEWYNAKIEIDKKADKDNVVNSINGEVGDVTLYVSDMDFTSGMTILEVFAEISEEFSYAINLKADQSKVDDLKQSKADNDNVVHSVNGKNGTVVLTGSNIEYGNGVTVKDKVDGLESQLDYNTDKINKHTDSKIYQGEVHGMKFNDKGKLEVYNGQEWIELKGGGLPVNITRNIEVVNEDDRQVELTWEDPDDVVIDGKTVAKWKSTVIVRKQGSKPINEDDGVIVGRSAIRNQYKDTPFIDTQGLVNDEEYYYGIFPESEDEILTISNIEIVSAIPNNNDDYANSPGSKNLVAGTMEQGFFGEVDVSEFISGSNLCSMLGITEGTNQFNTEPWLKFALDNKILFIPKKSIRHSISWDHIHSKNCVYGNKVINIKGLEYKVRLMKGTRDGIFNYDTMENYTKYSEWSKLMLPIHVRAKNNIWSPSKYVEKDVPYWGIDYTDSDLNFTKGKGSWVWCQDTDSEIKEYRMFRGGNSVSDVLADMSYLKNDTMGFLPVLEVLK